MMVRALRIVLSVVLGLLLLFDLVVVFKLCENGWPKQVKATDVRPGVISVKVTPIPFTKSDWWILAAFIGAHVLLIYLVRRFRVGRRPAITWSRPGS